MLRQGRSVRVATFQSSRQSNMPGCSVAAGSTIKELDANSETTNTEHDDLHGTGPADREVPTRGVAAGSRASLFTVDHLNRRSLTLARATCVARCLETDRIATASGDRPACCNDGRA